MVSILYLIRWAGPKPSQANHTESPKNRDFYLGTQG